MYSLVTGGSKSSNKLLSCKSFQEDGGQYKAGREGGKYRAGVLGVMLIKTAISHSTTKKASAREAFFVDFVWLLIVLECTTARVRYPLIDLS